MGRLTLGLLCAVLTTHSVDATAQPHPLSRFNVENARLGPTSSSTVSVQPDVLSGVSDWTVVYISSGGTAETGDTLAAYSPSTANITSTAPVLYFNVATACPSYLQTGKCDIEVRLINMREDYIFYVFSNGIAKPVTVGVSNTVTFADPNTPRAPRLFATGDATSMKLVWSSAVATNSPQATFWPSAGGGANVTVAAATSTYAAGDMCGGPATSAGYRDIGIINTAVLTPLTPGESYTYVFGDATGSADPVTFLAAPAGLTFPFGIAAWGDMGQDTLDGSTETYNFPPAPNTTRLVSRDIDEGLVHAIFHIGDISYARGYASEWDVFLDMITPISSRVTYAINQGNHEADFWNAPTWLKGNDSGGECGTPAFNLFPQPAVLPTDAWYSLVLGPVFAIHMSTEWDFTVGSRQWTFIKTALAAVNRSVTPWVIFNGHRPMYIDSTNYNVPDGDQTVALLLRQHVEPLLQDAGGAPVDLALWGHHHSYQRHCAVFNATCTQNSVGPEHIFHNPSAPVHMVIGTGGAAYSTNTMTPPPPYTEYVSFTHGYARITLHNASALEWRFVNDADGTVWDTLWIIK